MGATPDYQELITKQLLVSVSSCFIKTYLLYFITIHGVNTLVCFVFFNSSPYNA